MSHCIEKIAHKCGTSDGLQVFENDGQYDGYCFSCSTYVNDPYGNKKGPSASVLRNTRTDEEVQAELEGLHGLPTRALDTRGLRQEALSHFGVRVAVSEEDGVTPVARYFPFYNGSTVVAYKAKLMEPKKIWMVGKFREVDQMFGWQQAVVSGGRTLFITEGEDDAVALYQAIRDRSVGTDFSSRIPAVVSLTSGASSVRRDLSRDLEKIRATFKEVVFVFDQDEAGKQAEQEGLQILPTARTVSLPNKDANECVIKGHSRALADACLFNKIVPKNTRVVLASTMYEAGREQAKYGLSYPWPGLTKLTRGMRFGETYYLGAGVKMGKTTMRSALCAHLIQEHGIKVFMASPEETNKQTYQRVLGQVAGKVFHDPDTPFDYDAYDAASAAIGDNLLLLNVYQHMGWQSLRSDIMVALDQGAKAIFIDPITNLTNGVPSGEANTALQEVSQDLAAIAKDNQAVVFIFCHLKAPESGDSHERGGKVYSHQFAGSRAMMRSCHMMIGLEGNKDPDLEEEVRNQRRLVVLEDREFGASGVVPVYYNNKTGLYTEITK